jgi:hypothetical protein
MTHRVSSIVGAVLVMGLGGLFAAENGEQASDATEQSIRTYTNEDLEKLPPLPSLVIVDDAGEPIKFEGAEERWAFVDSVLGQAYARIDADRAHWIERRRAEAEADALERIHSRPRYLLPLNYFGRGYAVGHGPDRRLRREASRLWERPNAHLFQPITPIHARPYQTNLFTARSRFQASGGGQGGRNTGRGGGGGRGRAD